MTRQGTVTKVEGEIIHITTQPLECCSGGESCHCLQTGKIVAFKARKNADIEVKVGDFVEAAVDPGQSVSGLLKVFALPLLGFAVGWGISGLLSLDGAGRILGGFAAAAMGLLVSLLLFKADTKALPQLRRVIPTLDMVPRKEV